MNCAHVLSVIDAGPFANLTREHREAAMGHARDCQTCGAAVETSAAIVSALAALPRPAPPPDLEAQVLARIARMDEVRHAPVVHDREWPAWTTALGALTAGLTMIAWLGTEVFTVVAPPQLARLTTGFGAMPSTPGEMFLLAGGLLLYVLGLLAAPRRSR